MHFLAAAIFSPKSYEREILRVQGKYRVGGKDLYMKEEGLELASMAAKAGEYAKLIAAELKNGNYQIQPAHLREITVSGKVRVIYSFTLTDSFLHGVVSKTLHDHCMKAFSPNLHSYLPGKSCWSAVQSFANFNREYFNGPGEIKEKGLYILRRDIASYTDNIPVDDTSPLWPLLKEEIGFPENPDEFETRAWNYVRGVIQTQAYGLKDKELFTKQKGIATGSPISTTLFNVYMVKLDRRLDALKPAYYARYGDDICLADPSRGVTERASEIIRVSLDEHRLHSNEKKNQSFYLTRAGHKAPENNDPPLHENAIKNGYQGRDRVLFLGCEVTAKGTIGINAKIRTRFMRTVRTKLHKLDLKRKKLSVEEKIELAAEALETTLDPNYLLCQANASFLRHAITDRETLKDLDYSIAIEVLKEILGKRTPKNFRKIPIRKLRELGIHSLIHQRNRVGRLGQPKPVALLKEERDKKTNTHPTEKSAQRCPARPNSNPG